MVESTQQTLLDGKYITYGDKSVNDFVNDKHLKSETPDCSNVKIDFHFALICMIQKIYQCLKRKKTMIPLRILYL